MIVQACQHSKPQKHGKTSQGHQRYKCSLCGKTWTDSGLKPVGTMRTSLNPHFPDELPDFGMTVAPSS